MNTLRPFGVTLTPNPGDPVSQYTMSLAGNGSASIAFLVSLMRGMDIDLQRYRGGCYLDSE